MPKGNYDYDLECDRADTERDARVSVADTLAADAFHLLMRIKRSRVDLPFDSWASADALVVAAERFVESIK